MYSAVLSNQVSNEHKLDRISPLQGYSMQKHNLFAIERPNFIMSTPLVRAAGYLRANSTTEVIDGNKLRKETLFTQSVCNHKRYLPA